MKSKDEEKKQEPVPVLFANWLLEERWIRSLQESDSWERRFAYKEPEVKTTTELYSIFQNSAPLLDKQDEQEEGWISVKDRLPEFGVPVLWYTVVKWLSGDKSIRIFADKLLDHKVPVEFDGSFYCLHNENDYIAYEGDYYDECATHWMPLPNPPKV